jgi:type II secretory pathway pseudopilin PulG
MQSILIQVKRDALAFAEITIVVAVILGLAATALPGFLRAFKTNALLRRATVGGRIVEVK